MSELETKKVNKHRAELAKVLRQEANKITVNKKSHEIDICIKKVKQAIKVYQAEEARLFWEEFKKYYNSRKWRPFF